MKINLNADMGEGFGAYRIGHDNLLLKVVTSANVASGFHAGDPWVMTETLAMAKAEGVSVGAHPSYPDLQGFGRRVMHIQPDELKAITLYQIGALDGIARAAGLHVTHTKPHGALNNMACEDADIARAIAEAVRAYDPEMILLAPVFSELAKAGQEAGLPVALEVFADRAYTDAGHLLSRRQTGAVLHNPEDCVANIDNIFEMVLVAAKRARRIAHGADPMVELENDKPTVLALREIADGLVTSSILEEIEQPMAEDLLQPEATDEILPIRGISIGD